VNHRNALIVFDCDGVLIDSETLACGTVAEWLRSKGTAIANEEAIANYIGVSATSTFEDIRTRHGLDASPQDRDELNTLIVARLKESVQPMPGVEDVLRVLKPRYSICVATSSFPARVQASLTRTKLLEFFGDHVFTSTMVARGKPAPDLFLYAAQQMHAAPQDCVVIEDSTSGAQAAAAAKMSCIGFLGGSHVTAALGEKLKECGVLEIVDQMAGLPPLIDRILSSRSHGS
jgi:HAD superfamily hydrolase (TIGR01509 family)